MALVIKDRVKQTTTTTGTGTLTLNGTVDGFQTFAAALSDGDTTYYSIFEPSTNEWEVGLGTWTEGSSLLARTTVLASSNSGSAVNLTAQAEVFISQPAGKAAFFNADGDLELNRDPQTALQAATKEYVDTIAAAGLHYHDPVRVEKEGNLSATYDNGTAGVGATLTNNSTQAALVIDGVTLSTNDRVLIYEQTDATQNGVYTVTDTGSASTNWVLTRSTDTDSYAPSDPNSFGKGDAFFVLEGNAGAGELYVMNTEGTITFGTTNITFTQVASTAVYSAGNGITLTGTVFAADAGTGVTVDGTGINIGQAVETSSDVTFNSVTASLSGNVTGNVTGDVTGNADTATALETARNIGGVSFDGTASINLPGVNTTGNQDTTGNAATATAWETGRTISLTGDVTGSVTGVDGSGNATIATTIAANSVALSTDTTGNYVQSVASGNYITGGAAGSEGAALTIGVDATPNNTASKVVARDASGNFSAGTITANLTGTASNANTLDSLDSTQFLRSDTDDTTTGQLTVDNDNGIKVVSGTETANVYYTGYGIDSARSTTYIRPQADNTQTLYIGNWNNALDWNTIAMKVGDGDNVTINDNKVFHAGNDGSGSGLDADTVDSLQASSFLRSDASDTYTGVLTGPYLRLTGTGDASASSTTHAFQVGASGGGNIIMDANEIMARSNGAVSSLHLNADGGTVTIHNNTTAGTFTIGNNTVWHAGNDGSGSGLDADTTDGYQASESSTASTLAARNSSGDLSFRYGFSTYLNMTHSSATRSSDTIFYSSTDNYLRKNNATGFKDSLGLGTGDSPTFSGLSVAFNTDAYATIGRAHVGYMGWSDWAGFSHIDSDGTGSYALLQNPSGQTIVNAASGQTISLSINNGGIATVSSTGMNINGNLNAVDNIYVAGALYHEGDTNTYVSFSTDTIYLTAGGNNNFSLNSGYTNINQPMYNYSVYYEDYDALSGTSVTVNCNTAQAFSLTMTGNTTFTFNSVSSAWSTGFVLELTGNGGTVTWPTSVDWAGGTAPDAPASGETDIYVFWTRDGGTTWYGVLSVDAAA